MSDGRPDPGSETEASPEPPPRKAGFARKVGFGVLVLLALVDAAGLAAIGLGAIHREREISSLQSPGVSTTAGVPPSLGQSPTPARSRPCQRPTLIGSVAADGVAARAAPDPKAAVIATFSRENALGSQQVFDIVRELNTGGDTWYKARLPIRPNGTTGYILGKALKVAYTKYRLVVDRSKFTLTLFEGCRRVHTFPVGIGTGATPTPVGAFYLTGLFKPPDTNTIYGVSIYTLSGFSEVLTNWRLGGIIGLHGTNDPASVGRTASHGCIRMLNADILRLERILPLGTPIVIH